MMLIDSHTHLYLPEFDKDREEVVKNAINAGIQKMFLPNIDSGTHDGMISLCRMFPGILYPMMGLHPGSVKENYADELEIVRKNLSRGNYIAVGEIGIDLYWDKTFISQQEKAFASQLEMAIENKLPVVIHARDSFNEIFNILDNYKGSGITGVFHSFTGGKAEVEKILGYDFYLGINGIVTFKNSGLDKVVPIIPINRLLLETDSPYLSPVPKRGIRNESLHLLYINEFLSKLYAVSPEKLAEITSSNVLDLFKIN